MKRSGLLLFLILLSGCVDLPSLHKIEQTVLREHPDRTVVSVSGLITNRFEAEFHIYYTKAGESLEHEDVWLYHKMPEAWIRGGKESVR